MKHLLLIFTAVAAFSANAESARLDKETDEALVAAAEQLVKEGATETPAKTSEPVKTEAAATVEATPAPTAAKDAPAESLAMDMKDEAKIPVFTKSAKVQKSESSLVWRLLFSLGFIAVVSGVLIVAGRKYTAQKVKGGEKTRIEILHQMHLGPKRSLVLIRVAGEALLLGCTDQSVNMLKSIALIDDELENALGGAKDFNGFLEDEFAMEDVHNAIKTYRA